MPFAKRKIAQKLAIGLLLFFGVCCNQFFKAQAATGINAQIHFQGKVVNTDGTNVADDDYDFVFSLYSVAADGSAIWTESHTGANQVTVTDGIFHVELGSITTLPGSIDFNTDNIYLGVNFNSDGEMSPRVRFTAVPYAFNAKKVAGLTVTDTTGTLTIPDGTTLTLSGANNTTLTTTGVTDVTLPTTGTLATLAGTETFSNKTIDTGGLTMADTGWIGIGSGAGRILFDNATTDFVAVMGANFGIGIATPDQELDVDGDIEATGSVFVSGLDTSSAGALTIGGSNATSLSLCNSAGCDTIQIGTNADADTISIGDSLDGLTIASSAFNVNSSGAISGVSTFSSTGDWTWTATTPSITINAAETLTITNGTDSFAINTSGSAFSFTDGSNSYTFDVDSGPTYAGNARPTKQIVLSPEFSGGTLTAFYGAGTDTALTGTMTADVETTSGDDLRTFYEWSSSEASLNNYTVAVRITLPADFGAWTTSNALQMEYTTESTSASDNALDINGYLSSNTASAVFSDTDNVASVAETWTTATIDDSTLNNGDPDWDTAGQTIVIYFRLRSLSDNFVRLGDITLNYLGKF